MTARVMLVLIVRDEAPIIGERLKAVRDQVDAWVIVDTGSVDDTVTIVRDTMTGIPGGTKQHKWAGFADARSFAVATAQAWVDVHGEPGDEWWALLLDADTVAHFVPGWRKCLYGPDVVECDVHHGALRYKHPRLLRLNGHPWRWRGVVHEYLEVPSSMRVAHTRDLLWVEHGHGGARERKGQAVKYREDAELIAKTRAENLEPDLDSRYLFYEAQSWRDCGEIDLAIERYMERGRAVGWVGETFIAWLRAGELLWSKENWPGAYACWTAAWAVDPARAEAPIGLASLLRARSFWTPAYEMAKIAQRAAKNGVHGLFGDINVSWRADYEMAVAGSWVGTTESKAAGRRACLALVNGPHAPEHIRAAMKDALAAFYPPPARKVKR